MEYRAVVHGTKNVEGKLETVWLKDKEKVEKLGAHALIMYGGTHFTVEQREAAE